MSDGTMFKSMTREYENPLARRMLELFYTPGTSVPCEKCGGRIYAGDWPWCKGNKTDHDR